MESFSYDTWFTVRYVHVASIALLAGGAFASLALSRLGGRRRISERDARGSNGLRTHVLAHRRSDRCDGHQ